MNALTIVVIVGENTDSFARAIDLGLQLHNIPTIFIVPRDLSDLSVWLHDDSFTVNGNQVGGIVFRALPQSLLSSGFNTDDQAFCDAEIRAMWLAAINLDSVLAVNQYDASAWFEGLGWRIWRRRLLQWDIPSSEFAMGGVLGRRTWNWYPYGSGTPQPVPMKRTSRLLGVARTPSTQVQVSLCVCGNVISGESSSVIRDAAAYLHQSGIRICEIASDLEGHILTVETQPQIANGNKLDLATKLIVTALEAHLLNR